MPWYAWVGIGVVVLFAIIVILACCKAADRADRQMGLK